MLKIGVIGAGASGYFSAIHAAEAGAKVTLYEKTSKILAKVKVSGGGRCNVTHAAFETSRLVKNYPRGGNFLKKAFPNFNVKDTIKWFESRGVKLKTEVDGRIFPVSDQSQSIIDSLRQEADKWGVEVRLKSPITSIEAKSNGFELKCKDQLESYDRVIVTAGGSSKSEGFQMYKTLGHHIIDPIPSLFTFNSPQSSLKQMSGITVPNANVRLEGTKLAYKGPLLITHWGISGPAVLKLSAFGAQWLHDHHYKAKALIQWVSDKNEAEIKEALYQYKNQYPKRKITKHPLFELPQRLWGHLVENAQIPQSLQWSEINKKHLNKLEQQIFCYILHVDGKTTFKEEFVTAGGIDLKDINPKTMESRLIPHLYFAGEVLNVDGITGGFNFQAAWTTGYLAGISASKELDKR